MSKKTTAVTIICDAIGSREKSHNREYEESLHNIVETLKDKYKHNVSPFTIRNGDEIFGVSPRFSDGYRVLKDIYFLSRDQKIPMYVGIGYGFIYQHNLENPHQIQGSSIWDAADAIKLIKQNKSDIRPLLGLDKNLKFYVNCSGAKFPHININYQQYLILEKIKKRTDKQQKVIKLIEENPNLTLDEIGFKIDYQNNSGTNVSKLLNRAEYQLVQCAEHSLMQLLDEYQLRIQYDNDGE